MIKFFSILSMLVSIAAPIAGIESAHAERFQKGNNPQALIEASGKHKMVSNYKKLKKSAATSVTPWPDTYWPRYKFGTAWRYNEEDAGGNQIYTYRKNFFGIKEKIKSKFTLEELQNFSKEQIKCLSTAEKLDLANCDYSYYLYSKEKKAHRASAADWEGSCDGWSIAATKFEEPGQCDFVNNDGLTIPFSSADIKGLLIYATAHRNDNKSTMCGLRTGGSAFFKNLFNINDNDVNPGALHLILANLVGIQDEAFVFDRDPGPQVWNQPVYKYDVVSSQELIVDKDTWKKGIRREIAIENDVSYINEVARPSNEPLLGGPREKPMDMEEDAATRGFLVTKRYSYVLQLDEDDNIIGGYYTGLSKKDHPDMVWVQKAPELKDDFEVVKEIYEKSLQNK